MTDDLPLLQIGDLRVAYGGIEAVKGIELVVRAGELVALIGANGAGKTTVLKAVTGLIHPTAGEIRYLGETTRQLSTHRLVERGLVMVPEGRGVFTRMSIAENLLMGAYCRRDAPAVAHDFQAMLDLFPRLAERIDQLAGTLSGGEQQMLAMARALMTRPRLLLLDEPSMGLSPIMVDKIFETIRAVHARGTTILLVEQNARLALEAADRAYVMDSGTIGMHGHASRLLHDPGVRSAYLGESAAEVNASAKN